MLTIRAEQLSALSRSIQKRARKRLIEELQEEYPEECEAIDLEAYVDRAVERAKDYDVATEEGIGRYARLMILLERDFDEDPWAREILVSAEPMDAATRMNRLTAAAQAKEA